MVKQATRSRSPRIGIVLATYQPNAEFLRKQIDSLKAQTLPSWVCVVSDDASTPESRKVLEEAIAGDARFILRSQTERLGVYHNFESGLSALPADLDFFCFCDQDDIWKAQKLEKLVAAFSDDTTVMVHSDLSVIDARDHELYASCWKLEHRNPSAYTTELLLLKNSVTGCTLMARASLKTALLPFPPQSVRPRFHHDTWVSLVASCQGKITAVSEPLVRYRQHQLNVVGPVEAKRFSIRSLGDSAKWALFWSRCHHDFMVRQELSEALNHRLQRRKYNAFGRFPDFGAGIGLLWIYACWVRYSANDYAMYSLLGKARKDVARVVRGFRAIGRLLKSVGNKWNDGRRKWLERYRLIERTVEADEFINPKFMKPLKISIKPTEKKERRFQVLVPNLNPRSIAGGVNTAIKLAFEIAKHGEKVGFITTDESFSGFLKEEFFFYLRESFPGDADLAASMTFQDGADRDQGQVALGDHDILVATAWWTALLADFALENPTLKERKFIYLIQDYEPCFYPWSQDFALAESTYQKKNYVAIYNTEYLRDYFVRQQLEERGTGWVIQPEVDLKKFFYVSKPKEIGQPLRVFVYGRPSIHRNLFPFIVSGLEHWLTLREWGPDKIEIVSAGERHSTVRFSTGVEMKSLGKMDYSAYPSTLRHFDVGVSLMLSPHPSYPPLEMAASGLITVTNRYANKDLEGLSSNFVSCDVSLASFCEAMDRAVLKVPEFETRQMASRLSFGEATRMPRVVEEILRCHSP